MTAATDTPAPGGATKNTKVAKNIYLAKGKYQAVVMHAGKRIYLGSHATLEAAVKARDFELDRPELLARL
jgi:hypothetical protein